MSKGIRGLLSLDIEQRGSSDDAATLPPSWYSDADVFRRELDVVFASSWQLAAPLAVLPEPGDCFVTSVAQTPIVLTRDAAGSVRAFLNACRHRGHPVAMESGNRKVLRCPYHAWTYDLDGRLRKAPRSQREPCFPTEELSLIQVRHHVWRDLILVNLSGQGACFEATYPGLERLADERGLDLSDFTYFTSSSVRVEANWKAWTENLNECYHCSTIHSKSFGDAWDVVTDAYEWVSDTNLIGQFARPNRRAHYFKQAQGTMANVYLWPNTAVSVDDYIGVAASVVPVDVERTDVVSHVYVRNGVRAGVVREWLEMYNLTLREDVDVVQRQHQGLKARGFVSGRLLPRSEPGVARFQALVREALESAPPA
jgi:phenylpropionate dioxygenase-like ring-hydroxylating dioxygenase large terminal subunit